VDEFAKQNEVLTVEKKKKEKKPETTRTLKCRCGGCMGGRLSTLTWGGLARPVKKKARTRTAMYG
jgi:hypothetical protein